MKDYLKPRGANGTVSSNKLAAETRVKMRGYAFSLDSAIQFLNELRFYLDQPQIEYDRQYHSKITLAPQPWLDGDSIEFIFNNGDDKPICAKIVGADLSPMKEITPRFNAVIIQIEDGDIPIVGIECIDDSLKDRLNAMAANTLKLVRNGDI